MAMTNSIRQFVSSTPHMGMGIDITLCGDRAQ